LVLLDLAAVTCALMGARAVQGGVGVSWLFVAIVPLLWVVVLTVERAYEPRFLGVGSEEFRRVAHAGLAVTALLGCAAWLSGVDVSRGYAALALPLAVIATLVLRYTARKSLHRRRSRGACLARVLAVGYPEAIAGMVRLLRQERYHGMEITAACVPDGRQHPELQGLSVPVLGDFQAITSVVSLIDADEVAVLSCPEMDGPLLRRLGWSLEPTRAQLVVAPTLVEVVGPRVAVRPVCGLPLLQLERPEMRGVRLIAKEGLDRVGAAVLLVLASPLLLAVALAVALECRSAPVLFVQRRVGRGGVEFPMLKFRTMCAAAVAPEVGAARDAGNEVLFKMRRDPRVTRIGRVLRRYSLDELPQLVNVLRGQMSLVGPRPPLPSEVERYGDDMRRRFMVKPGLTGLWQINGRSDLTWDESVRLDLRYVENWSLTLDMMILWKTMFAVLRGRGAY
jgi:exopolysaccharide biosynthesis polyprenyl glycosylphosphotransferase